MDSFSPLNFILSLFGCNFFRKCLWIRVFGWILFILHVFKAFFSLRAYTNIFSRRAITEMIWYLENVFDLVFVLIMVWNRKYFEGILRRSTQNLSISDKKSLWKLSIFGMIITLSVSVKDMISFHLETFGRKYTLWTNIRNVFWAWSMKDSFLICGRIVFCYFIRLVTLEEKRFLRSIVDQPLTPSLVSVKRRNFQAYRQFVVDKFSIIPVLWFLRELIMLVAIIVSHEEGWAKINSTRYFLACLLFSVTPMATHTFMTCYIDHCVMDVREEIAKMTTILAQKNYRKWRSIIIEFDIEIDKHGITTCSMIEINKQTGLSFISNLITLTILFQQLVSSLH